ncbi:MAG: LamG-like jellyroll fold domain-containing protein [Candidatus Micrarchaeia archaeon]
MKDKLNSQLTLEFAVVYSYVLLVFLIIFAAISSQRAITLANQEGLSLQFLAENIATTINQALQAGNGYSTTIQLQGSVTTQSYNITISSSGVIIVSTRIGAQTIKSYAFSNAKNIFINGTELRSSTPSLKLYNLNISNDNIKITNVKGTIYINENPVNVSSLPSALFDSNIKRAYVAAMQNSCLYNNQSYFNDQSNFTINMWIYPLSYNSILYYDGNSTKYSTINITNTGSVCISTFNRGLGVSGGNVSLCSINHLMLDKWNNVFISLTKGGIDTGTFTIFVNNNETSGLGQEESIINANITKIGCNTPIISQSNYYGYIGNIQIYNSSLSLLKEQILYNHGLISNPQTTNLTALFKLDNTPYDYSGMNHNLLASNIIYIPVLQINQTIMSNNASIAVPPFLRGIAVQNGNIDGSAQASLRSCYYPFVYIEPTQSNVTSTITLFNGNQSLIGNCTGANSMLVDWWPINEGFKNTAYDFGTNKNNLFFNALNGFPAWQNRNQRQANFESMLDTANSPGYITTDIPYSNINSFTIALWVNGANTLKMESSNGYTLLNSAGTNNFEMWLNNGGGLGSTVGTGDEEIGFGNIVYHGYGVNGNSWNFLAISVYNGFATFYANNNPPYTISVVNAPYSLLNLAIGQSAQGISIFNGTISNLQIYNTTLNQGNIQELYDEGITGAPVDLNHLIAWYPLYGNAEDYSINRYNGSTTNVIFVNSNFTEQVLSNTSDSLMFNPIGQNALFAETSNSLGSYATLIAWINPKNIQTPGSTIFYYGPTTSCPSTTGNVLQLNLSQSYSVGLSLGCEGISSQAIPLMQNTWNFVAARINNTKITLFVNNNQFNTTLPSSPYIQTGNIIIGGLTQSSGIFNGMISDVQLYKSALSNSQIIQLEEQGMPSSQRLLLGG